MVSAVAGLLSPTLKAKLEAQEAERSALVSDCAATDAPPVVSLLARLADSYAKLVENLEHVRLGYLARARTALKSLNRRSATPP